MTTVNKGKSFFAHLTTKVLKNHAGTVGDIAKTRVKKQNDKNPIIVHHLQNTVERSSVSLQLKKLAVSSFLSQARFVITSFTFYQ